MKDFTATFFVNNRTQLRQRCDDGTPIVLTANGAVQRAGDSAFRFRQDSNFWYLTGLEEQELILVMTAASEFIILPPRSSITDIFDGAIDTAQISEVSGIEKIYDHQTGWEQLGKITRKHKKLHTCLYKGYDDRHNIYYNPAKPRLVSQLKKLHTDITLLDIRRELAHLRMIKQKPEIAAIQQAVDITCSSLAAVFDASWGKNYKNEADVERDITYQFARHGAKSHAYPPIIASGKNACTLHYGSNNQPIQETELLLIDAGAEYGNYAADITRVFSPSKPTKRQAAVYEAVKTVQAQTIDLLKPGVLLREVEQKVEKFIAAQLTLLGLAKKADTAAIRKYYPHSFSHHLGLDVHDVADYDIPLAPDMVITVEPGLYIAEENIGVRIEDDVCITPQGSKILSKKLPQRLR